MKKMMTTILSTATIAGVLASGATAFADQNINGNLGNTSGEVQVNGIIGEFDNTVPGPNPEDVNEWINVTIPTTALFYTTAASGHKEIVSPEYTIMNNSAVGVVATVAGVDTPVNMREIDSLSVKTVTDNLNSIELFKDGEATVVATELFTLAGNQGDNENKFTFSGEATPVNASAESNPSFKLVLNFAPSL